MPTYKVFNETDIIHYNLKTSPKTILASGVLGWRGSTGISGSISMYGGLRAKEPTSEISISPIYFLQTPTIDGAIELTASYPFTGTVQFKQLDDREITLTEKLNGAIWGQERLSTINNLYDYYKRLSSDYTTSSYDYYCLYFSHSKNNKVTYTGSYLTATSSFSIEALIKPLSISGTTDNYSLISRKNVFSLFITGSDGRVCFSGSDGSATIFTSSISLNKDKWNNVYFVAGDNSCTFYIDMKEAGSYVYTGSLDAGVVTDNIVLGSNQNNQHNFHGFFHDVRFWDIKRNFSLLSASHNKTFVTSGSHNLLLYSRFNDGPLSVEHGHPRGSGAFDYSIKKSHGLLEEFNQRKEPIWHPNDNKNFFDIEKKLKTEKPYSFLIVSVPSLYYSRNIATGSVRMVCNAFISSSIKRTLVDDGRGGLYLLGSMNSSSLDSEKSVFWNKVGNVFYSDGLLVIKDPSLLDFGQYNQNSFLQNDIFQLSFNGESTIPTKVFNCRANSGELNCSLNKTFSNRNFQTGKLDIVRKDSTTWITGVGIYDENRELVAVAKFAQPVRKREKDKINFKLSLDW